MKMTSFCALRPNIEHMTLDDIFDTFRDYDYTMRIDDILIMSLAKTKMIYIQSETTNNTIIILYRNIDLDTGNPLNYDFDYGTKPCEVSYYFNNDPIENLQTPIIELLHRYMKVKSAKKVNV